MAEFLVQLKDHWMDGVNRSKWDYFKLEKFKRRNIKGCPIVVKPDGCPWGKEECPPNYAVIKVPNLSIAEGEIYIQAWDRICEFNELTEWTHKTAARLESISQEEAISENEQTALTNLWIEHGQLERHLIIEDVKFNDITFTFTGLTPEEQHSLWIQKLETRYPQCIVKDLKLGEVDLNFDGKRITTLKTTIYSKAEQKTHFIAEEGMWSKKIRRRQYTLPEELLLHNSIMTKTQFLASIIDRKQQMAGDLI